MVRNKWFNLLVVALVSLFFVGCDEAKQGADEIADEVTGKNKIEKKIEMEKEIENLTNKHNKNVEEALENNKK